jgi:hypothetical protein
MQIAQETGARSAGGGCTLGVLGLAQHQAQRIHLPESAHAIWASMIASDLLSTSAVRPITPSVDGQKPGKLQELIVAKNKLWFDYWRPQNWAFLAGDRTAQPSSRDHVDPSKRWFPPEREAFLPLIEAKEKEIDALAAQLASAQGTR